MFLRHYEGIGVSTEKAGCTALTMNIEKQMF